MPQHRGTLSMCTQVCQLRQSQMPNTVPVHPSGSLEQSIQLRQDSRTVAARRWTELRVAWCQGHNVSALQDEEGSGKAVSEDRTAWQSEQAWYCSVPCEVKMVNAVTTCISPKEKGRETKSDGITRKNRAIPLLWWFKDTRISWPQTRSLRSQCCFRNFHTPQLRSEHLRVNSLITSGRSREKKDPSQRLFS